MIAGAWEERMSRSKRIVSVQGRSLLQPSESAAAELSGTRGILTAALWQH